MDYTQFALAAMGPVLTAVLAAVAVAVREMTESKRRREDQTYRLERIAQQVQSVSAWLDAHGRSPISTRRPTRQELSWRPSSAGSMPACSASSEPHPPARGVRVRWFAISF